MEVKNELEQREITVSLSEQLCKCGLDATPEIIRHLYCLIEVRDAIHNHAFLIRRKNEIVDIIQEYEKYSWHPSIFLPNSEEAHKLVNSDGTNMQIAQNEKTDVDTFTGVFNINELFKDKDESMNIIVNEETHEVVKERVQEVKANFGSPMPVSKAYPRFQEAGISPMYKQGSFNARQTLLANEKEKDKDDNMYEIIEEDGSMMESNETEDREDHMDDDDEKDTVSEDKLLEEQVMAFNEDASKDDEVQHPSQVHVVSESENETSMKQPSKVEENDVENKKFPEEFDTSRAERSPSPNNLFQKAETSSTVSLNDLRKTFGKKHEDKEIAKLRNVQWKRWDVCGRLHRVSDPRRHTYLVLL